MERPFTRPANLANGPLPFDEVSMVFRGIIKKGSIVTTDPIDLPDGTEVEVRVLRSTTSATAKRSPLQRSANPKPRAKPKRPSTKPNEGWLYDMFRHTIGRLNGLPPDFSVNHDYSLYGVPKQMP